MAEWQLLSDSGTLALEASRRIARAARRAIAARGMFSLVLAGGTTPRRSYERLAGSEQEWAAWRLFYGDERCLPPGHPERNSRMVEATGLAEKAGAHHPIPAELGAEAAAEDYAGTIRDELPFDLVLLGMGEDGHTASLFPGREYPGGLVIPVHDAPKPPPDRVSLTPGALRACREMLVLVAGGSKREALARWRAGADLPVARVADLPQATVLVERRLLESPL